MSDSERRIVPCLWFNGDAQQGADFYVAAFPNAEVLGTTYYPTAGLADFQQQMAGKELTIELDLGGYRVTLLNAGPEFPITQAISLMIGFPSQSEEPSNERVSALWDQLAPGGKILMPLTEYPFSPYYGWVQDKFGMSWQLITAPAQSKAGPPVLPSLLFSGSVQNKAREAVEFYLSVFPASQLGSLNEYPQDTGPASKGSVLFADFRLMGQWFAAMDSGVPQESGFTEGVSFQIMCRDQEEIDHLWNALSVVPESAQCGWCKDRFGVSWQIVPANMAELMQRPGAFAKLMAMDKIEIDGF